MSRLIQGPCSAPAPGAGGHGEQWPHRGNVGTPGRAVSAGHCSDTCQCRAVWAGTGDVFLQHRRPSCA